MMNRNTDLAKIHMGRKQLGLDEETYRAMLDGMFGVTSSGKLNFKQRYQLICRMEELGAEFSRKAKANPQQPKRQSADFYVIPNDVPFAQQKRYILTLWKALGWSMKGVDTRMRSQFGIDSLVWLQDQESLQRIAKDLVNRCRKAGIDPENA